MFAFARRMRGRSELDISDLEIDWGLNFRAVLKLGAPCDTLKAIHSYNDYCESPEKLKDDCDHNHEWLLRMEHGRWRSFARAEGLRTPTIDELETYASVFWNDEDSYRSDEAGLHARLVPFDDLPEAYERWREVRALKCGDDGGDDGNPDEDFQERNEKHLQVEE